MLQSYPATKGTFLYNRMPASLNFLVSFFRQDNADTHNVVMMESSSVSFLSTHLLPFR